MSLAPGTSEIIKYYSGTAFHFLNLSSTHALKIIQTAAAISHNRVDLLRLIYSTPCSFSTCDPKNPSSDLALCSARLDRDGDGCGRRRRCSNYRASTRGWTPSFSRDELVSADNEGQRVEDAWAAVDR